MSLMRFRSRRNLYNPLLQHTWFHVHRPSKEFIGIWVCNDVWFQYPSTWTKHRQVLWIIASPRRSWYRLKMWLLHDVKLRKRPQNCINTDVVVIINYYIFSQDTCWLFKYNTSMWYILIIWMCVNLSCIIKSILYKNASILIVFNCNNPSMYGTKPYLDQHPPQQKGPSATATRPTQLRSSSSFSCSAANRR